jgi:hypothetical protein
MMNRDANHPVGLEDGDGTFAIARLNICIFLRILHHLRAEHPQGNMRWQVLPLRQPDLPQRVVFQLLHRINIPFVERSSNTIDCPSFRPRFQHLAFLIFDNSQGYPYHYENMA